VGRLRLDPFSPHRRAAVPTGLFDQLGEMIAAGVEVMKELVGRFPSVIASMAIRAMLHAASWRPNYDEAEPSAKTR
jgi:hypothetical protein